jgi:hypothetical protein
MVANVRGMRLLEVGRSRRFDADFRRQPIKSGQWRGVGRMMVMIDGPIGRVGPELQEGVAVADVSATAVVQRQEHETEERQGPQRSSPGTHGELGQWPSHNPSRYA